MSGPNTYIYTCVTGSDPNTKWFELGFGVLSGKGNGGAGVPGRYSLPAKPRRVLAAREKRIGREEKGKKFLVDTKNHPSNKII